jgi:pimeloyl-ACP methyl ester carboxylesterase
MEAGFPKIEIGKKGDKKPTIIFLAGFPDNQLSPWGCHLRDSISKDYHTIFLCLPGFEERGVPKRWGHNFNELLDLMNLTILNGTEKDEKIFLVGHDWGSHISLLYQNKFPERVQKLVLLDIGMLKLSTATFSQIWHIALYQGWFALSFLFSQFFGKAVAYRYFYLFHLVAFCFPGLWYKTDEDLKAKGELDNNIVYRTYPYFYLWKSLVTFTIKYPTFPTCPLLYMVRFEYGFFQFS